MATNIVSSHRHSGRYAGSVYDDEKELRSVRARVATNVKQLRKHIEDPREFLVWETLDAIDDSSLRKTYRRLKSIVKQDLDYLERDQDDLDELDLRNPSDFRFFDKHQTHIATEIKEGLKSLRDLVSFRNTLE